MLKDVGITNTIGEAVKDTGYKMKQNIEDFVVYEVCEEGICAPGPLISLEKYLAAEKAVENIPEMVPKEERKALYDALRHYPFKRLVNRDGKFLIETPGRDIYACTVMKYNLNTVEAAKIISKRLGIPTQCVQFSGNKDKYAITYQEMSIDCEFERLFQYALSLDKNDAIPESKFTDFKAFKDENEQVCERVGSVISIEPYEVHDRLRIFNIRRGSVKRMGENLGNRFTIKITGLHDVSTQPRLFLNYFGPQRFGKYFNNHLIGESILDGKFSEALDIILQENRPSAEGDASGPKYEHLSSTQRYINKKREAGVSDRSIVYGLDRLVRMMYMHAYQSYLFNQAVNKRVESGHSYDGDMVLQDGKMVAADEHARLDDIYIPLEKKNDKFLKGGYRKMIEELQDFSWERTDDGGYASFTLNKSCYATCALRELIGDAACLHPMGDGSSE